jgi:hypothetical protein
MKRHEASPSVTPTNVHEMIFSQAAPFTTGIDILARRRVERRLWGALLGGALRLRLRRLRERRSLLRLLCLRDFFVASAIAFPYLSKCPLQLM